MDDRPLPAPRPPAPARVDSELQRAASYAASALAPATRRAYEQDWRTFADWCAPRGLDAGYQDRQTEIPWWGGRTLSYAFPAR
jgi:hypothetical protein